MSILSLIAGESYWVINKTLARKVGNDAALLFSDLCQAQNYWNTKKGFEDYFFKVEEDLEEDVNLTPYLQRKAIKRLKEYGLIKTKRKDIPAKRYYLIDDECLNNLLLKIFTTSRENSSQQVDKLLHITKEYKNSNSSNSNSNKDMSLLKVEANDEEEKSPKKVAPKKAPKYLAEMEEVLLLFNELTKVKHKVPPVNRITKYGPYKLVKARLEDGATLQEMKNIIIFKCKEWEHKPRMKQYRNYNTILRKTNFDKYLIEYQLADNKTTNNETTNNKEGGILDGLGQILEDSRNKGFI